VLSAIKYFNKRVKCVKDRVSVTECLRVGRGRGED